MPGDTVRLGPLLMRAVLHLVKNVLLPCAVMKVGQGIVVPVPVAVQNLLPHGGRPHEGEHDELVNANR